MASNPGRHHQPTSRVASGRLGSHQSSNGRVTNGHINKSTSHRPTADRLDARGFREHEDDGDDMEFKEEDEYGMDLTQ